MTPTATLQKVVPASAPIHGGALVRVWGPTLGARALGAAHANGSRYTCRFSAPAAALAAAGGAVAVARVMPARYYPDEGVVRCAAPRSPAVRRSTVHADLDTYAPLAGQLHVSLNGADYDEEAPIPFGWYDPPNVLGLSPNSGPVLGGTPIAVWAPNATDGAGTDRRCRFTPHFFQYATEDDMEEARLRTTEVAATRRDEGATNGTLRCVTPALPPDVRAVELEVSLNGQQFTRDGVRFTIEKDPKYKGHTPSAPNGYAEGSIFARVLPDSSTSPFIPGALTSPFYPTDEEWPPEAEVGRAPSAGGQHAGGPNAVVGPSTSPEDDKRVAEEINRAAHLVNEAQAEEYWAKIEAEFAPYPVSNFGGLMGGSAEEEYKRVRKRVEELRTVGDSILNHPQWGEKELDELELPPREGLEEVRNPAEMGFEQYMRTHALGADGDGSTSPWGGGPDGCWVDHAVESGLVEKAEEDAEWKREEGIAGEFGSSPMWKEIEEDEAKREAEAKKLREEYGARY